MLQENSTFKKTMKPQKEGSSEFGIIFRDFKHSQVITYVCETFQICNKIKFHTLFVITYYIFH